VYKFERLKVNQFRLRKTQGGFRVKKLFIAALAFIMLSVMSAPAFAAYKDEYKLDIVPSLTTAWGMGASYFADLVKQRTDGRVNIKVYPNSQLTTGKQTNAFMLLRNGAIDFAVQSTINYSPQIEQLNLFALPFFIANQPDRYKALDAVTGGKAGAMIGKILEEKGAVFLGYGENGFRELTNSKRDIRKPADMNGMKFRVVGSPLFLDIFTALGSNPTAMSWADTMSAIQQGVVDGQENPINTFYPLRVTEYHKFVTNWHYIADPTLFVVNPAAWKTIPPADQEIIRQAAKDAGEYQKALSRCGIDENDGGANLKYLQDLKMTPEVTDWTAKLRSEGISFVDLTADETQAFVDATKSVYEKWEPKVGADLMKAARDDMAAVAKK
jgi:tripartite ATP-independent transporter DctP family solute receptor